MSEVVKLGRKTSTKSLFGGSCNKIPSLFSDSDSDDSIIPNKIHEEKVLELEKAIKILKSKNSALKAEMESLKSKFDEVHSLNISLQTKLLNLVKTPIESSLPLNVSGAPSQNALNSASPSISFLSPCFNKSSASIADEVHENLSTTQAMDNVKEEQFCLEDSYLSKINFRVKPGQPGDSLFVKNLASALFSADVLLTSSVTGIKCNAVKDSVAKPALCPKRLDYIKKLLNERMDQEFPVCPIDERKKRINKINAFIAEKIITMSRKK